MAKQVRIVMNRDGARALLKSPGVKADLERRARAIAARAGEGHIVDSRVGKTRARASVVTSTADARRREATDRNLLKSLDAGRS